MILCVSCILCRKHDSHVLESSFIWCHKTGTRFIVQSFNSSCNLGIFQVWANLNLFVYQIQPHMKTSFEVKDALDWKAVIESRARVRHSEQKNTISTQGSLENTSCAMLVLQNLAEKYIAFVDCFRPILTDTFCMIATLQQVPEDVDQHPPHHKFCEAGYIRNDQLCVAFHWSTNIDTKKVQELSVNLGKIESKIFLNMIQRAHCSDFPPVFASTNRQIIWFYKFANIFTTVTK